MLSIAEKIKLKLADLEKYNIEDPEDNYSYLNDSEEESNKDNKILNLEEIELNSLKEDKPLNAIINNKVNIENNIESKEKLVKQEDKDNKHNFLNNNLLTNDLNFKINEFVNNKINRKSIKEDINSNLNSEQKRKSINIVKKNSQLNYQNNYSTDLSQDIDINQKFNTYNYVELGEIHKVENLYGSEQEEEDINVSFKNNNSNFTKTNFEREKKYSGSTCATNEILDYRNNYNLNRKNRENDIDNIITRNQNEIKKRSFVVLKEECKQLFENKNTNENNFDEINLLDKKSFNNEKMNDNIIYRNNRITSENQIFTLMDINDINDIDSNQSEFRRSALHIIEFIVQMLFILMMICLLLLDPLIIFLLKLIDYIRESIDKYSKNKHLNTKASNKNGSENHLLFCSEIEEIDFNNLENFENIRDRNLTLYERYLNYFFNNGEYKNQRRIIKISFIVISLLINICILSLIENKIYKLLFFFVNNLYLLYHTMDVYNERLLGYTDNLKWSNILNKV